ncbi:MULTISPECIES: GNAT family N-acetyltransferase [Nonomuraea]|uniref:GNAT family N-acetyltransferase n=1 Tax=Nonomuraea mangrovi TaxID=2316207 RepID=A0ABW4T1F6_9ACTN
MALDVRPIGREDREIVLRVLASRWGGPLVVGHGEVMDAGSLPGLLAHLDGDLAGLLTYAPRGDAWEVVTVDALIPGKGAATALLDAVRQAAREAGAARLWLVTTNDNTHALRFYQRYGFDLVALRTNAVDEARRLKPSIPAVSDGIPISHELELALTP